MLNKQIRSKNNQKVMIIWNCILKLYKSNGSRENKYLPMQLFSPTITPDWHWWDPQVPHEGSVGLIMLKEHHQSSTQSNTFKIQLLKTSLSNINLLSDPNLFFPNVLLTVTYCNMCYSAIQSNNLKVQF